MAAQEESTFDKAQYQDAYPDGIESHWWNLARSSIIAAELRTAGLSATNILEIGCGRGAAIESLAAMGIETRGVELATINPLANVSQKVVTGTDARDLPEQLRHGIETILLLDVVEHLADPKHFLEQIIEAFPAAKTVLLTVPAGPKLWSNYDDHFGHLRRYDLLMLSHLANTLGATLLKNSYFFHALYLPARLMNLLQIKRSVLTLPPQGRLQALWHRCLARIMKWDYRLLPASVKGSSALAIMRVADR